MGETLSPTPALYISRCLPVARGCLTVAVPIFIAPQQLMLVSSYHRCSGCSGWKHYEKIWLPDDTDWSSSRWTTNEVPNKIPLCGIRCHCAAYYTEFRLFGKRWKKWVNKAYYRVICIVQNVIQVFGHEYFFPWSVHRVRGWSRLRGLKNRIKGWKISFPMCTCDYYNQGCLFYPKKIF